MSVGSLQIYIQSYITVTIPVSGLIMGGTLPALPPLLTPTVDYDIRVARFGLGAPPTEISIFINDSSISELHFSIRSYIEQITNQIRKFFGLPEAARNFPPEVFYFHL